jgi:hypothetical protein
MKIFVFRTYCSVTEKFTNKSKFWCSFDSIEIYNEWKLIVFILKINNVSLFFYFNFFSRLFLLLKIRIKFLI